MNFFKNRFVVDILFILLLSLTPILWFGNTYIMAGHDLVFPLNPNIFLQGRLFSWISQGFGQSQSLIMGTIPIHVIDAIPYFLGFSVQTTQKLVYIFWFFMIGISAYVLANTLEKKSSIFKLTTVLLYQFNFFILQAWWIGERTKFSAYIAFPLILACFIKTYKGEFTPIKSAILISLILFFFNGGGLYGISLYGGLFVAVGVFLLFFSFLSYKKKEFSKIKSLSLVTGLSFIGFLLVNAYYILPTISQFVSQYTAGIGKGGGVSGFLNWASEISANASYINIFRLQGVAEWYDNVEHPYAKYYLTNPLLITLSFLWPLLLFSTLFIRERKEKTEYILYFFLVYLLGVFFVAGTHSPLGFFYGLFIEHVPGAIAFRSPYYKFAPSIFLASSFLIAYLIDHFRGKVKILCFFLLLVTVLLYHFPFFTGDFFSWKKGFSTRLNIPEYVFAFGQWLNNEKSDDGRVIFLPSNNPDIQVSAYSWGYLSFQALPSLLSNKALIVNNDRLNNEERVLVSVFYTAIEKGNVALVEKVASLLKIKYIVLQEDINKDFTSPKQYIDSFFPSLLENTFHYPLVKTFDKWKLFALPQTDIQIFSVNDTFDVVESVEGLTAESFSNYSSIAEKNSQFLLDNEKIYAENKAEIYTIPRCINCEYKIKPVINVPERVILPDSPLYPLLIYKEKQLLKNKENNKKTLVFDDLGISLIRAGEINGMIRKKKGIQPGIYNAYIDSLAQLRGHFEQITDFEEKMEAATAMQYYLEGEQRYLSFLLGNVVEGGYIGDRLQEILYKIEETKQLSAPYTFQYDPLQNRLYRFTIKNPGQYDILLKNDKMENVLENKIKLQVTIDASQTKEIETTLKSPAEQWISFGKITIPEGNHQLLVSFPEIPNVLSEFIYNADKSSLIPNTNCYSAKIVDLDKRKVYLLSVEYATFPKQVMLYTRQSAKTNDIASSVVKLQKEPEKLAYETLIYPKSETENVTIDICGTDFSIADLREKLDITVKEIVSPQIVLKDGTKRPSVVRNITYTQINPTKYTVNLQTTKKSEVLLFMERFDDKWILSEFDYGHIKVNGYGNGWVIDKPGTYKLILEYKPQKYSYLGGVISIMSIILGSLYLLFQRKRKHDSK